MIYKLIFTKTALKDIDVWKKSGNKSVLKKIETILNELIESPTSGTGQPEELKHNFSGYWSRRISQKDRIVYSIDEENSEVIIYLIKGHYEDA